jgi:hypothetical protein
MIKENKIKNSYPEADNEFTTKKYIDSLVANAKKIELVVGSEFLNLLYLNNLQWS